MGRQGRNVVSSFIIYYCTRYCITTCVLLLYRRTTSSSTVYHIVQCNVMSRSLFKCKVRVILVLERRGVCGQEFQGVSGYEAKLGDPRERKEFQVA